MKHLTLKLAGRFWLAVRPFWGRFHESLPWHLFAVPDPARFSSSTEILRNVRRITGGAGGFAQNLCRIENRCRLKGQQGVDGDGDEEKCEVGDGAVEDAHG